MAEIPLNMPKMSMTMDEGTIVEWSVAAGDEISADDVVAVVMTDKVDMEVESPTSGTVARLLATEGDVVPVGEPMAMITSEEEDLLGDLFSGDDSEQVPDGDDAAPAEPSEAAGLEESDKSSATGPDMPPTVPLARKLAKDHGLDLRSITPTGPHGTVRTKDVKDAIRDGERDATEAHPTASTPEPASSTTSERAPFVAPVVEAGTEELMGDARSRRVRQATAAAVGPTAAVPQFTAFRAMDLSAAARARSAVLEGVSWTTLIVRAYAILLRENEPLNGYWAGKGITRNDHVVVVLAVDTPDGLMIPILEEPDQRPLRDLDREVRDVAAQAKAGTVDPSRLGEGTGTVSNLGSLGVDRFNALVTPPQATALSVGTVAHVPVVNPDGTFGSRLSCELGLSIDHRVADGADAARALDRLQDLLGDPLRLAL